MQLAEFAAGVTYDALPKEVKDQLYASLIDYVRVASIGERMEWSAWAAALAKRLGGTGGAHILFSKELTDPVRATFVNATYAGSIDADDTHVGAMLHPGAIIFSTAFALAQDRKLGGAEVLAAVAAGYESMIRVALSIQPAHFRRGFQSTATCGVFGAGVAAAHLLFRGKDSAQRIAETIGIAASFSGGITQFYHSGSTVKRIHAAHAATEGLQAALMAEAGFTGPTDAIEGKDGYARAYAGEWSPEVLTEGLGSVYRIPEVSIKPHAASARVQAAIEATARLCSEHRIDVARLRTIRLGIPKVIQGRLTTNEPRDLQAAQKSEPYAVGLTLAKAKDLAPGFALTVDDFERGLADAQTVALTKRVECVLDDDVERVSTAESVGAKLTLELGDGTSHSVFIEAPQGSVARPFANADHEARFRNELGRRLPPDACEKLLASLRDLPTLRDTAAIAASLA
jgi:2-methylcitrate dehydratase PrpD